MSQRALSWGARVFISDFMSRDGFLQSNAFYKSSFSRRQKTWLGNKKHSFYVRLTKK